VVRAFPGKVPGMSFYDYATSRPLVGNHAQPYRLDMLSEGTRTPGPEEAGQRDGNGCELGSIEEGSPP